jgi:3-methyladenine DNA glycosylase/8-oxoguanine DNA glycosylase
MIITETRLGLTTVAMSSGFSSLRRFNEETFLFPTPEALVNASLEEIKTTTQRKKAIKELCQYLIDKKMNCAEYQGPDNFKKQLRSIKDIGSWSAEYICLRALGDTNAFPKDDLILKRALSFQHFDSSQLEPWRGYLAIYLWKKYAEILSKQRKKNENT